MTRCGCARDQSWVGLLGTKSSDGGRPGCYRGGGSSSLAPAAAPADRGSGRVGGVSAARRIAVIGAALDLGSGRRGVDMGPSAIRYAQLFEQVTALGYELIDHGNV